MQYVFSHQIVVKYGPRQKRRFGVRNVVLQLRQSSKIIVIVNLQMKWSMMHFSIAAQLITAATLSKRNKRLFSNV